MKKFIFLIFLFLFVYTISLSKHQGKIVVISIKTLKAEKTYYVEFSNYKKLNNFKIYDRDEWE